MGGRFSNATATAGARFGAAQLRAHTTTNLVSAKKRRIYAFIQIELVLESGKEIWQITADKKPIEIHIHTRKSICIYASSQACCACERSSKMQ